MNEDYGRNLDLNLLRVFLVVAEEGSVTTAASRLYLTQPAVSAALRRLTDAVGTPLFARQGRGLALTSRGTTLLTTVRPHLAALVDGALSPGRFDPTTSDRGFRLGLLDAAQGWLLPALLRVLERQAPLIRLVVVPVQFRNVASAMLTRQVDLAVTVADELPGSIHRQALFVGGFTCLFDPRHARLKKKLTERDYFAHDHVIVSYNADLRGIVEDLLGKSRRVRCSVASFGRHWRDRGQYRPFWPRSRPRLRFRSEGYAPICAPSTCPSGSPARRWSSSGPRRRTTIRRDASCGRPS